MEKQCFIISYIISYHIISFSLWKKSSSDLSSHSDESQTLTRRTQADGTCWLSLSYPYTLPAPTHYDPAALASLLSFDYANQLQHQALTVDYGLYLDC